MRPAPSAPPARAGGSSPFTMLPTEIHLAVVSYLEIPDVLALRAAGSRVLRDRIDANLPRHGLARQVARNTYPRARLLLRAPPPPSPSAPSSPSSPRRASHGASRSGAPGSPTDPQGDNAPDSPHVAGARGPAGHPSQPASSSSSVRPAAHAAPSPFGCSKSNRDGDGRDLRWLKSRIPMRLAAIAVDRCTFWDVLSGPPAEESSGDEVRARVANGWRVYRLLSLVGRKVHEMSRAQVLKEAVLGSDRVTGSDGEDATPDMEKANFAARNGARMLARALLGVHGWGERDYQRENRLNWEDLVKKARQQFGREARRTREKKKDTAKRGGPQQPQTKSAKDDTTLDLLLTEARENLTWRRRLTLLERLSPADCHDFRLLFHFLFCAFHCEDYPVWETTYSSTDEGMAVEPYFFDCYRNRYPYALIPGENYKPPRIVADARRRHLTRGNCWMTWILLHEGPDLFLTQWTPANKRPTHVRDVMCAAWACRSPRQVSIERRYASWAWYAIYWRSLGKTRLHTFRYNHTVNTSPFGRQPHIQRYFVTVGGYLRRLSAGSSVGGGHGDDGVIDDSLYGGNGGGRDMGIKSQIAWYLWQKGVIKIDEDFEVGDYFDAEDARRLLFHKDEKGLDSLDDIAYEVCL